MVPKLAELLPSPSAPTRATVISCIRFAVTELGPSPLPECLQGDSILPFLSTLEDADLKVRRNALLALNCLAHNKPRAVQPLLPSLLPLLYNETAKRSELVHQVDLGPFKHTVDDGLELRKAAFETMETLLTKASDSLHVQLEPSPSPSPWPLTSALTSTSTLTQAATRSTSRSSRGSSTA